MNKKEYNLENPNQNWNFSALIFWLIASVVGIMTTSNSNGGFGLFELTTIPAIDALLISFILYSIINKVRGIKNA